MPYLVVAVVLVALLGLVNLVLTLALIRRLRAQDTFRPEHAGPPTTLGPGAEIGDFTTTTVDGEPVTPADLTGLVGFFSAGCKPCHDLLPSFVEHAKGRAREQVLAVVTGDDRDTVEALAPVARVVAEDYDGTVTTAFQNAWTPALYVIDADHRVVATGGRLEHLPAESLA
jgi:hypothetical protein